MAERLVNLSRENLRLQRADVVFGDVEYGPGGSCGPRVQRDYQLVIMHEGTLDIEIDGTTLPLGTGQAILLCPGRREQLRFHPRPPRPGTRGARCLPGRSPPICGGPCARRPGRWHGRPACSGSSTSGKECGAFAAEDIVIEARRFQHLALLLMAEFLAERRRQSRWITDPRVEKMQRFIALEYRRPAGSRGPGAGRGPEQTIPAPDLPLPEPGVAAGATLPATTSSRLRSAAPHRPFDQGNLRSMRICGPVSFLAEVQAVEPLFTARLPSKILIIAFFGCL